MYRVEILGLGRIGKIEIAKAIYDHLNLLGAMNLNYGNLTKVWKHTEVRYFIFLFSMSSITFL